MSADLAEFLLARIAEDEAVARAAITRTSDGEHARWVATEDGDSVYLDILGATVATGPYGGGIGDEAHHIGRWDPARVLAECEARRRIVLLTGAAEDGSDALLDQVRVVTLKLLALPYADHDGYREEWRP